MKLVESMLLVPGTILSLSISVDSYGKMGSLSEKENIILAFLKEGLYSMFQRKSYMNVPENDCPYNLSKISLC